MFQGCPIKSDILQHNATALNMFSCSYTIQLPVCCCCRSIPDLYCSIAAAANSRLNYIIEVDFPAQKLLIKLQFTIPSQVPEMFDPDFGNITIYVV